jgi:hypothetical protein
MVDRITYECSDARRFISIAIHKREKSGHHRPLTPLQDRPQDIRSIRTYQEHVNSPCFNRRGTINKHRSEDGAFRVKGSQTEPPGIGNELLHSERLTGCIYHLRRTSILNRVNFCWF